MKRKIIIAIVSAVLLVSLTGCSPLGLDAQTLMKPPKATGDKQEIYDVLEKKTNNQLRLRYPKAGDYRSAIIMKDVTGDGNEEAIAFYSSGDEPFTTMSVISDIDGTWTEINSFKNPATQIDRICFGDFSGNGVTEFAVGWGNSTTGTSELNLYDYQNNQFHELKTKESYNELAVLNLNNGTKSGILTARLSTTDSPAVAKLYGIVDHNLDLMGTAALDSDVIKYNKVTVGKIGDNDTAVILDGIKSARSYNTEILYWDSKKAKLKNPLYQPDSKSTLYTSRSTSIPSQDINGDGIIEIPITHMMPGFTQETINDTSFITTWQRYDVSTNTFTSVLSTVVNSKDGYMFMIPDAWKDGVTTSWDEANRSLTFYGWNASKTDLDAGKRGDALLTIRVLTEDEWMKDTSGAKLYKLKQHENMVFVAELPTPDSKLALTIDQVEYYFRLYAQL